MRHKARDDGPPAGAAKPGLAGKPVDRTGTRAETAAFKEPARFLDPPEKGPFAVRFHI